MFRRKLIALNHPAPESVNAEDPKQFRNTVLWLEDQKIRIYKIEDRAGLRKVDNPQEWDTAYTKFKKDLDFPTNLKSPTEELMWLLNHAVRLEYYDNAEKFKPMTAEQITKDKKPVAPTVKSTNQFDNLDFESQEFKSGIRSLANKLGIPYHPDHLETLRAVSKVVKNNLGVEALKEQIPEGQPFPFQTGPGINLKDNEVQKAARILQLLQTQSVRKLQTGFNEIIAAVQNVTADPRTDTKLGKVGC